MSYITKLIGRTDALVAEVELNADELRKEAEAEIQQDQLSILEKTNRSVDSYLVNMESRKLRLEEEISLRQKELAQVDTVIAAFNSAKTILSPE